MSEVLYDQNSDKNARGYCIPVKGCVEGGPLPTETAGISQSRGKDLAQQPGGTFRIAGDDTSSDLLHLYDKTGAPVSFDSVPVGYDRDTTTDNNYIR